jgi:hypothetical protein
LSISKPINDQARHATPEATADLLVMEFSIRPMARTPSNRLFANGDSYALPPMTEHGLHRDLWKRGLRRELRTKHRSGQALVIDPQSPAIVWFAVAHVNCSSCLILWTTPGHIVSVHGA